jgi:predicted NAD/FAD-binding protein
MRIAVIGSGISGLVAAWRLHRAHDVTVFEANGYVGGHTHTVDVELDGERHAIDTGFIVFNDRTYPHFCRLLDELGVASQPTSMSFSVRCDRTGLEYNGTSFNGLFAQRRNLLRPGFLRMLRDVLRFNREAGQLLDGDDDALTVGDYLRRERYSREFAEHYLLPMGSAIWSCPRTTFEGFPIRFIAEFYRHHGLLQIRDRPTWRVVTGGSRRYVEALTRGFRDRIRLHTPVQSVLREEEGILVQPRGGSPESFDEVIFACHADQSLAILGRAATPVEREVLGCFPYEPNLAVLHTDASVLPRRRRAWASWNYRIPPHESARATVTYNLTLLQRLRTSHTFCVTLNDEAAIDPARVLGRYRYSHPVFTLARSRAQRRHSELIRSHRTSFCGAYWGNGFHEDGVKSALAVSRRFEATPLVESRREVAHA